MSKLLYVANGPYQMQVGVTMLVGNGPHLRTRPLRDDEDTSAYLSWRDTSFMTVEAREYLSRFNLENPAIPDWRNDPSYDWGGSVA